MAKSYTYPRVAVSATAKQHSSVQPPVADTTVMFVPLVTEKGPNKEIVSVHSLSEFISTFGNLSYEKNGQMALNVYNWLRNGGTCYVYRMAGYDGQKKAIITSNDTSEWKYDVTYTTSAEVKMNFTLDDLAETVEHATYFVDIANKQRILYMVPDNDTDDTNKDRIIYTQAPSNFDITVAAEGNYYFTADGTIRGTTIRPAKAAEGIDAKNALFVVAKGAIAKDAAKALYYTEKKDSKDTEVVIKNKEAELLILKKDPEKNKQAILNLEFEIEQLKKSISVGEAKYFGEYYNDISIAVKILSSTKDPDTKEIDNVTFNLTVFETTKISATQFATTAVESFPRRNLKNYKTSMVSSDFIAVGFDIDADLKKAAKDGVTDLKYYFKDADDAGIDTDLEALKIFWNDSEAGPAVVLGNPTETPVDIIFDAGYPMDIKNAMMSFINNVNNGQNEGRPDIVGIFDTYELKKAANGKVGYLETPVLNDWSAFDTHGVATNIALYDQYFMISDEMFTGQNIFVTPTYFLSKMIAYNDMNYGIQFPTAGIRRGVLDDAEAIFVNPTADEKETMFKARVNYAEKTPREYAFMCQRTHDNSSEESYTALSFLNNIRVLEKMKKELERLGRNYLFEFNDSITLANLSSILNKYVMNWIANRTLASGVVTVAKNPWSDEAVDVNLTIKFNGTIEVISVDITIE